MRTVYAMLVAASALAAALPAHASCGATPRMRVWPHRGVPVPINARVFMTIPSAWRTAPRFNGATFDLVTAPSKTRTVTRIPLAGREWKTADVQRFELTPQGRLEPNTPYELWSSHGEVLGVFTTSVMEDKRPPTWGGVTRGSTYPARSRVIDVECGSSQIDAEGPTEAVDDQTTSADIRYAIWAAKSGAPLDYDSPPLGWTTRSPYRPPGEFGLDFGNTEFSDIEVPAERPLRIGIKAYDLAGNGSGPSEIVVNDRRR